MSIFIVKTHKMQQSIREKEPYKSFLRKYDAVKDENMEHINLCIDLAIGSSSSDNAFTFERYYFSDPLCRFSYFNVKNQEDAKDMFLVCHELEFGFDDNFTGIITDGLLGIKNKQQYIYLPGVEEFEITYHIEFEKAVLEINAVTNKKELLEEISMMLLSLDVALLAKGW